MFFNKRDSIRQPQSIDMYTEIRKMAVERREETLTSVNRKMDEIPLLEDIIEYLCGLEVNENRSAKITISVQDFKKCENTTYEKIIKQ